MDEEAERVVIIGTEKHYGVHSTTWTGEGMPNIADYDKVIIDTSSFDYILEKARVDKTYREQNEELLRRIRDNQNSVKERLIHLLHSNGDIYSICSQHQWCSISMYTSCDNYAWSPIPIYTVEEYGKTKKVIENIFEHYLQFVNEWSFYFRTEYEYSSLREIHDFYKEKYYVRPVISVIAENRYKKPLSIAMWYQLYEFDNDRDLDRAIESPSDFNSDEAKHIHTSGSIILLPPPTKIDRREAISMIIEDHLGIHQKTPPPNGIDKIFVPGEGSLKREIKDNLDKIEELKAKISELATLEKGKTQFKQLIYETGTPLEDICKLTFGELGCEVDDSIEDFILIKGDKEAIVEVKGREGTILRGDGSQLAQNRRNYVVQKEKDIREVKAILLGNPWRVEFPIEERDKKEPFAPHLVKDAQVEDMALVSTVELFNAYCAFLEGRVTSEDIINRLFLGVGITQLLERTQA